MIFNTFDPNKDVVAGRTTRVASGFWPNGVTDWYQSNGNLVDDFWSLTGSVGYPSYGTSPFDVRRTMYYLNVFPAGYYPNDPYFSIAYGNIYGAAGSGSFAYDVSTIQAFAPKAIYQQYKNMLLGTLDFDGMFTMASGSLGGQLNAYDIWVIDFSSYKMKDRVDEGFLEFTLSGSNGSLTLIDDSLYSTQNLSVYEIIAAPGGLDNPPAQATYQGIGLFYPTNGVVVLNAAVVANLIGVNATVGVGQNTGGPLPDFSWPYQPGLETNLQYAYNHKTLFQALVGANFFIKTRKSEYVNSRHYFVRIMNRDFNYSNNPTYVYDGTDGIHAKGTILNTDFITDPKTYITTIGLYDDNNELVAVSKLSRPALKSFDQELLVRVRLDF